SQELPEREPRARNRARGRAYREVLVPLGPQLGCDRTMKTPGLALLLLLAQLAPSEHPQDRRVEGEKDRYADGPSPDQRWAKMDYGPFLTAAVTMPWPQNAVTPKGIVLKVGTGAVCFDTDLLRYAGGWTGGWLDLLGPPFEGSRKPDLRTRPVPKGTMRFATSNRPGWARGDEFRDPRQDQMGPLPSDIAKYRGLYVHGDRAVFSYI